MRMLIKALILPPGLQLLMLAVGLVLTAKSSASLRLKRLGYGFILGGFLSMLFFSLPVSVAALFEGLEIYPPLTDAQVKEFEGQAIVVLSGGIARGAPEWGRDVSASHTALRLRYGVKLYRQYQLPLLLSGGAVYAGAVPEAEVMGRDLSSDFQVSAEWLEVSSRNTWENAQYSAELLAQHNIKRVILVTDAWHMRRAVGAFEHFGMEVLPAPTGFKQGNKISFVRHLLPSSSSLSDARMGLHEYGGLIYYWWLAND